MERNEWKGWRTTVCLMLVSCVVALSASHGGFRNVTIDNIEVYDTFRSAIAIETVDGGGLENVRVTRVQARNTGNPLFIRLGHRAGEKPGYLRNIYISQMKVEVPFGRPDEDYDLRGPAVTFFHNPIPSSVTGIPGSQVENVVIEDVEIRYPGRATKGMAYVPLWRLDAVPEAVEEYPEFMFCPLCCRHTACRSGRSDRCGAAR